MTTRLQAKRELHAARDLVKGLGAHITDIGILQNGKDWLIEIGVSRPLPRPSSDRLEVNGVKLRIVADYAPNREELLEKSRARLRQKGLTS